MMTLREQFEAWGQERFPETWEMNSGLIAREKVYLWQAFQAGHAASGREELLAALRQIELAFYDSPAHGALACKMVGIATEAIKKARSE